jgi:hypothetical protein
MVIFGGFFINIFIYIDYKQYRESIGVALRKGRLSVELAKEKVSVWLKLIMVVCSLGRHKFILPSS